MVLGLSAGHAVMYPVVIMVNINSIKPGTGRPELLLGAILGLLMGLIYGDNGKENGNY